jgi:hypothetical protein
MRWILLALLLMFSVGAAASEMWRWVDERGVVHYSDRPQPGAERVELKPAQSYTAPATPPPSPARSATPDAPRQPAVSYSRLSIVSPSEGENLWNIGAQLSVQLEMDPPLAPGHRQQVYLDGVRVADAPQGTQFTLGDVFRGERRLRVSIVDENDRELASSGTVMFYVHQASRLNPNQPQRATPRPGGG